VAWQRAMPTNGLESDEPTAKELEELVPKVRAVLGDELDHLELVSIDGKVLARWSSSPDTTGRGAREIDDAP